jgi:arginase
MAEIELIGVPFDGYGRAGNQARAAVALRDAGLLDAFEHHHVADHGDLDLPAPDPARGASTSLINERALLAMTADLNTRVGSALAAGRFPFVYGGDCSMLLGIVTGLRDHVGDTGLVFVDGHEDTMPLDVSEDGEAANTEIGLLLGLTGRLLTGELGDRLPALRPEHLVVLGPRDDAWRRQFNVGTLADSGVWVAPLAEVADDPTGTGRRAMAHVARSVDRWWLHIDLDVLDRAEFSAQGLPDIDDEPGGLTWEQLTDLVIAFFSTSTSCVGGSIAIYDPDQDPGATCARQIVAFIRNIVSRPTIRR